MLPAFSAPFQAALQAKFGERLSLPTSLMAAVEEDASPRLSKTASALADAGLPSSTVRDRVLLREACVNVSTRAARLAAVGVVSLLEQMEGGAADATVAVDGTVFELYPCARAARAILRAPSCHSSVPPNLGASHAASMVHMHARVRRYFKERMEFGVELLLGKKRARSIDLVLAKDGSGVGAAIISALAD